MTKKVSLVLEGGGMRGAYTAGCLAWLIDHNIEFDAHYGISTGAIHMVSYLFKSKEFLYDMSTKIIADKRAIGIRAFLREKRIVSYDYMFDEILAKVYGYPFEKIKELNKKAKIGLYDLLSGKTEYHTLDGIGLNEMKAACSLPIIGKIVKVGSHEYLDGGISDMIPISESVYDGNDNHLIITTKPAGYVRKPAKQIAVNFMRLCYPECPSISDDYKIRHLNYSKQIDLIKELVDKHKAAYFYPSRTIKVSRLRGDIKKLNELYELGIEDMERRKEEIHALFK